MEVYGQALFSDAGTIKATTNDAFVTPDIVKQRSPIVDAFYQGGQALGAPITGLSSEVAQSATNLGRGAGNALMETGYGLGQGLNYTLSYGVGKSLENIGTSGGKGLNNLAIGALPAVGILIIAVIAISLAGKV